MRVKTKHFEARTAEAIKVNYVDTYNIYIILSRLMTHVHIIVVLITFLVNEFKIFKNWIWYLTKKKALQFFLIFFSNDQSKQTMFHEASLW